MSEGAEIVRENDVDLILAIGGGSVIDCAKAISVSAYCEGDSWSHYWINFEPIANRIVPDYEARSNLMWSSSLAMNPIMGLSKTQDWEVHMIEHQLGAYTDCAHGMGLAAVSLPYYRFIYRFGLDKFVRFATQVYAEEILNILKDAYSAE